MADNQEPALQEGDVKKTIHPVKIYLKDVSFETPNSPAIFLKEWKPELDLELGNSIALTNDGHHEVVQIITATVKVGGETAYLAELHQAGVFSIQGQSEEELQRTYRIFCNRYLYPYASAALSDLVTKGGFPQLLLSPINWVQIYKQSLNEETSKATTPESN